MDFSDRTVLVTGAAGDIGRTTAERFADEGARVVVCDVDEEGARTTVASIEAAGGDAHFRPLDVTDLEAFRAVVDATADAHGLDVLVNNAGVIHEAGVLTETSEAELEHLLAVNVRGTWNGCYAALSHLGDADAIVNVASVAGQTGAPRLATYSLTKGAVMNFTRSVAAEAGRNGVRVNAVCPGFVDAGIARDFFADHDDPEAVRETVRQEYPLGRLGEATDVANAVVWLASDQAAWVTGHGLTVDGGFSAF